jgi:hypothetical protein
VQWTELSNGREWVLPDDDGVTLRRVTAHRQPFTHAPIEAYAVTGPGHESSSHPISAEAVDAAEASLPAGLRERL